MAKCIRYYRPYGVHIARVSNTQAAHAVSKGEAMYCPKNWWKAARKREEEERS